MAWFGCIDSTYTLLLRFTFWGASSKSDYLVCLLTLWRIELNVNVLYKTYISKPIPSVKRFDAGALTGFPGVPPSANIGKLAG